jgi:putative pyruvate formate lyase activating enzyme
MAYLTVYKKNKREFLLDVKKKLYSYLSKCNICPRKCGINRLKGEVGYCKGSALASIASYGPHFGEEAPLVGRHGSGTIFFSGCSLGCIFCQNYDISSEPSGRGYTDDEIAKIMLSLQDKGCHNINLVTPTHYVPQIVSAIIRASENGLYIPVVYNSSGYDLAEIIELLEPTIDIFMPDMKFSSKDIARRFCNAPDYPEINMKAVETMHNIAGDLKVNSYGIAVRGLIIRHLVLPENLAGTKEIAEFVANKISKKAFFNLMAQYHPCYKALKYKEISRRITQSEWNEAVEITHKAGLEIERVYFVNQD